MGSIGAQANVQGTRAKETPKDGEYLNKKAKPDF